MFPQSEATCETYGCRRLETLAHILQTCHRTHGPRVKRYDNILNRLAKEIHGKKKWKVVVEPHLNTTQGTKIPDIVISNGPKVFIIDVSITADNASLSSAHRAKAEKYIGFETKREAARLFDLSSDAVEISDCIFNWRGIIAIESASLLNEICLNNTFIELLSVIF